MCCCPMTVVVTSYKMPIASLSIIWAFFVFSTIASPDHHRHVKTKVADGCRHIYIDMGTNVGHQINKLYQPHLYSGNPTEQIFQQYFGTEADRERVCAFGFEANPVHDDQLQRLETHLVGLNKRVHIYTSQAVSTFDGNVKFFQDPCSTAQSVGSIFEY